MSASEPPRRGEQYAQLIQEVFLSHYSEGVEEVPFHREDIVRAAQRLGLPRPRNIGDVIYSFRYRNDLPPTVVSRAPEGRAWVILPAGQARYRFVAVPRELTNITPTTGRAETKVPDATPGIVARHALGDEQALLARLRYNRLVDIFTGVASYSLQSHLRTSVPDIGQVETDEIYVGVDRRGAQYVFPVQAKGGTDRLSVVQIAQDIAMCSVRFPELICRPIAAQFMGRELIAMFEFEQGNVGIPVVAEERHYRLIPSDEVTPELLRAYRTRTE